jgi:hypothetical protein
MRERTRRLLGIRPGVVKGIPVPNGPLCAVCGDDEPVHVHCGKKRIEDYFTVGRGESDFAAALRWRERALRAEGKKP